MYLNYLKGLQTFIFQFLPPIISQRKPIFDCCKQSLTRLLLPSIHPPIHPPTHPSIHPLQSTFCVRRFAFGFYSHLSIHPPTHPPIHPSIHLLQSTFCMKIKPFWAKIKRSLTIGYSFAVLAH